MTFWENYLQGAILAIPLPKLPGATDFPAQSICYNVDLETTKKVRECLQEKVDDGVLASFAILLAHYCGQEDLLIGLPPLLIRIIINLNHTLSQILEQIGTNIQMIQGREPPTGISPSVAFQEQGIDLSLFCESQLDSLELKIVCRKGLYNEQFLSHMIKNLAQLLRGLVEHPDKPIHTIGYVNSLELEEIFRMSRGKRSPFPKERAVHRLFEERALKYPNLPALDYEGKIISYRELNALANQLARHLKQLKVEKGEFVGLAVDRSIDHIIGLLGILKADAVPVPIDASYPLERKQLMLEDVKAKVLVVQSSYAGLFPIPELKIFSLDTERDKIKHYPVENLEGRAGPLDLVNINYTSGSTGKPKGVKVIHKGVARLVINTDWFSFTSKDRMLHMANVSFDAASFEIWGALLNGGCLCIYPHKEFSALLSGATGFIGSFMLKELIDKTSAEITCLIRADSIEGGKKRLELALKKYGLWNPEYSKRINLLVGDLDQPQLGIPEHEFSRLAENIDCIYHFGAFVNHSLPYSQLKAANVSGTIEMLKLACARRVKPLHFISTVAVFEAKAGVRIHEDDDLLPSKNLINSYAESKWIAEKLVKTARTRNLPVNIYRLARVSGHSRTGQSNANDFLWRMVETSIQLQLAPDIALQENITPVDFVCSAIRTIAGSPKWINGQFHVINPELFPYKKIFHILQKLGYPLRFVTYEKWRRALVEAAMERGQSRLQAVAPLFSEIDLSHSDQVVIFEDKNTRQALKTQNVTCPHVDEQMIITYIDALVTKGILPPYKLITLPAGESI